MPFLTYDDVKSLRRSLNEAHVIKLAGVGLQSKRVFLAHSSLDKDFLAAAISLFEGLGAGVYVDDGDHRLPNHTSAMTANILRETIATLPRCVVMVSPNTKDSRWVPWELGLADGSKGGSRVALLPIVASPIEDAWVEQEYLGLYPRIQYGAVTGYQGTQWLVFDPSSGSYGLLKAWLF